MEYSLVDRAFYDAIIDFERNEEAQNYYYEVLYSKTGKLLPDGSKEMVKDLILRVYAMLFCEDTDLATGAPAGPDEVEETADRLYIGAPSLDPDHWCRMKYHFPVIDDDNYIRFAALVISDLKAGPLNDAVMGNNEDMLLVGEKNPLLMTTDQRKNQKVSVIELK